MEQVHENTGEPIGTGWRTAAWMAFALAILIAWPVNTTKPTDMVQGAVLAMGALLMLFVAGLGVVFALFGAAASAGVGDKRLVVILPVVANAALVLWIIALIFAP